MVERLLRWIESPSVVEVDGDLSRGGLTMINCLRGGVVLSAL